MTCKQVALQSKRIELAAACMHVYHKQHAEIKDQLCRQLQLTLTQSYTATMSLHKPHLTNADMASNLKWMEARKARVQQDAYSKQNKVGQATKCKQVPVLDTETGFRLHVKYSGSLIHVITWWLMNTIPLPFLRRFAAATPATPATAMLACCNCLVFHPTRQWWAYWSASSAVIVAGGPTRMYGEHSSYQKLLLELLHLHPLGYLGQLQVATASSTASPSVSAVCPPFPNLSARTPRSATPR